MLPGDGRVRPCIYLPWAVCTEEICGIHDFLCIGCSAACYCSSPVQEKNGIPHILGTTFAMGLGLLLFYLVVMVLVPQCLPHECSWGS